MKKSRSIMLSAAFLAAITFQSCQEKPRHKDQWISGKSSKKDSVANNQTYRHYGGMWYPVYGGRINPGVYEGHSHSEISSGRITPTRVSSGTASAGIRSGGFGSSSHVSVGA
jgi:hypothetical protein